MKELLQRLERYGVGVRALNEDDFYRLCSEMGIEVIHSKEKFAFTFTMTGRTFIVLPTRVKGWNWLFRAFHEWAHVAAGHAQHSVHAAFYGLETQFHAKNEVEADIIALTAMIPLHRINEMAAEMGETRAGDKIWRDRCRLAFLYGI